MKAHEAGYLSFELFQVEYPERIDLNLCVGVFRIGGEDLPAGYAIKEGDAMAFDWRMSDSGILQASVQLEDGVNAPLELRRGVSMRRRPGRCRSPARTALKFAGFILKQGEEEWGDLAAAAGPEGGPEVKLLQTRLSNKSEMLEEAAQRCRNHPPRDRGSALHPPGHRAHQPRNIAAQCCSAGSAR